MKTKIKFKKQQEISDAIIQEMWSLYEPYYAYSYEYFINRFLKNTHIALFYHSDELVGFSGMRVDRVSQNGKKKLFINFGQAVMDKKFRGKSILQILSMQIGFRFFWDLLFREGYCWIDAISFKSYLFYANSMAEFYPSRKWETSPQAKMAIDYLGQKYYGAAFCPKKGTVEKVQNFVKDSSAVITQRHLSSPDIRFFAEANPGHSQGNGLITVVPMSLKNLNHIAHCFVKKATRKVIRKGRARAMFYVNKRMYSKKYSN